jgi:hypothetical protein
MLIAAIPSTWAQARDEVSFRQTTYSVGDLAVGLALGDLNGDGATDVVATDSASPNVHIRLNDGDGGFRPAMVLPLSSGQPRDAAVIDLDGDIDADLAVLVREGSSAVLIYRNLGDGQLAAPLEYGPTSITFSLSIGDFNQDSFPDIAYATGMTATEISVLLNLGNGSFGPATLYPLSNPPITYVADVAAGDVTGDDMPDLIGVLANDSTVAVFINNGNGAFGPAQPLSIGNQGFAPEGVALGDLDMDDDLDLAVFEAVFPDPDRVRIAINDGRGGFGNPVTVDVGHVSTPFTTPMTPVIADLDGDGLADVAVAQRVIMNSANGFEEAIVLADLTVGSNFAAASADLNADGLSDLAFTWQENVNSSVSVCLNLTIPAVLGDLTDDGVVGPADLAQLLASWGACPTEGDCPADLNRDEVTDPFDLAILLTNWG